MFEFRISLRRPFAISREIFVPIRSAYPIIFIKAASSSRTFVSMFFAIYSIISGDTVFP